MGRTERDEEGECHLAKLVAVGVLEGPLPNTELCARLPGAGAGKRRGGRKQIFIHKPLGETKAAVPRARPPPHTSHADTEPLQEVPEGAAQPESRSGLCEL